MEQQPHRAYEQAKSKQKQNQVTANSKWPRAGFIALTRAFNFPALVFNHTTRAFSFLIRAFSFWTVNS